jgi:hypothetical protein
MNNRVCYLAYVYVLPSRWLFTGIGHWLLRRASAFAYTDREAPARDDRPTATAKRRHSPWPDSDLPKGGESRR